MQRKTTTCNRNSLRRIYTFFCCDDRRRRWRRRCVCGSLLKSYKRTRTDPRRANERNGKSPIISDLIYLLWFCSHHLIVFISISSDVLGTWLKMHFGRSLNHISSETFTVQGTGTSFDGELLSQQNTNERWIVLISYCLTKTYPICNYFWPVPVHTQCTECK